MYINNNVYISCMPLITKPDKNSNENMSFLYILCVTCSAFLSFIFNSYKLNSSWEPISVSTIFWVKAALSVTLAGP